MNIQYRTDHMIITTTKTVYYIVYTEQQRIYHIHTIYFSKFVTFAKDAERLIDISFFVLLWKFMCINAAHNIDKLKCSTFI